MSDRQTGRPLYEQVAQRIAAQIDCGIYRVGDAIPSVRRGMKLFRVSAGTMLEAYRKLEDRGLIRVRPQSGYYVRQRPNTVIEPPRITSTSARPREISGHIAVEMLRQMVSADVLQLGAAVPDPAFLPTQELNIRLARALRIHGASVHGYGPIAGLPKLRQRLARYMAEGGCTVSPDELIVTNGCTEALHLCLKAVTRPRDIVAIESPAYYGLLLALKAMQVRALPIESSPVEGMSITALAEAAKSHRIAAVIVTPSFTNPTGACMPQAARQQLIAWARDTDTPIIEDDIYGELHFDDQRPSPLKALDTTGHVLHCNSISKTISPGLRIGWCAPGRFHDRVEQLKASSNPTSLIAPQHALADFLDNGGVNRHLRRLRRHYRNQIDRFRDSFASILSVPFRLNRPTGGHLLWMELPAEADAVQIFHHAMKKKISIAPGPIFSPSKGFANYMRINCAVPWTVSIDRAIHTLDSIIRKVSAR